MSGPLRKILCCTGIIVLTHTATLAQKQTPIFVGADDTDISKQVKPWKAASAGEYTGAYHFGESEAEWTLRVLKLDSFLIIQCISGEWGPNAQSWIRKFRTFNKLIVKEGAFTFGEYTGYFAKYTIDGKAEMGVVLQDKRNKTSIGAVGKEFGFKTDGDIEQHFEGKYPQLSCRIVEDAWLNKQSKDELQLMRNEILARYCMRFQKGGKMDVYFSKQDWYQPQHNNVMQWLTDIEKINLDKVQRIEKAP